ncbi:MAG: hypothetical protein HN952_07065 [Candidatus Cloacimonetes bacterium]|jgi:hypothetical protein|nr:hypothetical protein [Candidatus Cloacimonadota bacterium]MBT7470056.1 hypothetical protein [Candidatus Cloacimonadota bacterium]
MKKQILVLGFLLVAVSGFTIVINVPADYETIQAGLNVATEGDSVIVADGIYYENITWPAVNGIKLIGESEENCIIDGNEISSIIRFEEDLNGIIDSTTVIKYFTIQNGAVNYGGLYIHNSHPIIMHTSIRENVKVGVYCIDSMPLFYNVKIYDNFWGDNGVGVHLLRSDAIFTNVLIHNNAGVFGNAGLYCDDSNPILTNVTITKHIYVIGFGGYPYGIKVTNGSNPILNNCIIWDNGYSICSHSYDLSINYSNIEGGYTGEGNIATDPLFIDIENGDLHLLADSPCIDAGIDVGLPYYGIAPDMGAFEWEVELNYGDVDGNGEVQTYDASLTLQNAVSLIEFTEEQTITGDVDGNGIIQTYDASLILQYAAGLIDAFPVE